jgi:hypothetical protein
MFRLGLGLSAAVDADALTVTHSGGVSVYPLGGTIADLIDAIEADGHVVDWQSDAGTSIGAHTLLPQASGAMVSAYSSLTWAHFDALAVALGAARDSIPPMIAQVNLPDSVGEWADLFGSIFGVVRIPGESDADYTRRIIVETARERSNPASILGNIERATGLSLALREPWMECFVLGESALSGLDCIQGAPIYQYHTMQLVADRGPDWSTILPSAEADRPAGTIMLPPATHPPPFIHDGGLADDSFVQSSSRVDTYAKFLEWFDDAPEVYSALVNIVGLETLGLRGPYRGAGVDGWFGRWDSRTWNTNRPRLEMYPPLSFDADGEEIVPEIPDGQFGLIDSGAFLLYDSDGFIITVQS